jgi:DNA repair protein RadA/Sms
LLVGKSTLVMQILGSLAKKGITSIYASAEESSSQIRSRASRLGVVAKEIGVVATSKVEEIIAHANETKSSLLIVDSIHTVCCAEISSSAGTVSQVRECAHRLTEFAKRTGTTVILVGQVTKEGTLAGPRVLEHVVDTVLSFEGDDHALVRTLRVSKHRFGNTDELGLFDMTPQGLIALDSDSALMANVGSMRPSGLVVGAAVDGSRPFLIEVQALVDTTTNPNPRRIVQGFEQARLNSLLAVLNKRCNLNLSFHDVYVSLSGGIRIKDPGLDLAICVAIASALKEIPILKENVFAGEIGLSGEVRSSPHTARRIREADRRGYKQIFLNVGKNDINALDVESIQITNDTLLKTILGQMGI